MKYEDASEEEFEEMEEWTHKSASLLYLDVLRLKYDKNLLTNNQIYDTILTESEE